MLCGHSFCQVSPALVLEVALELVHETVKVGLLRLAGFQYLLVASPAPPVPRLDCTVVKVATVAFTAVAIVARLVARAHERVLWDSVDLYGLLHHCVSLQGTPNLPYIYWY